MVSFLAHNRRWTIAVIAGFLMLLLSLGAVLLVFPALTTAQCEPQLTVQGVSTQDTSGTEKTSFAPGETIRFVAEVNNGYGGWLLGSNGTWLAVTTVSIALLTRLISRPAAVRGPGRQLPQPKRATTPLR